MILYGHRGARGELPENTLVSFEHAMRAGVNGIELDVRLSADDQLVVIHDETVDRTMNASGLVSSFTAAELSQLNACNDQNLWTERVGVPTLNDTLEIVQSVPNLQLEIKTDIPEELAKICRLITDSISDFGLHSRSEIVSSYPNALEMIRTLLPKQKIALIGTIIDGSFFGRAKSLGCTGVCAFLANCSAEIVDSAHKNGFDVTVWPGNTEQEIRTLIDWGVEGITSDYPTMAVRLLRERYLL